MNYQGHLTNATGQPLATGQYTLIFNVYNVPTGGSAVWGPQAIVADVVDGYFNVVLSTDSTGGDSITAAFMAQPRYVSISVNAAAEILPRQQVLSAPYAIQSSRAEVVAPATGAGNIFPATGRVGIGTTTPDRELSVSGESRFSGNVEIGGVLAASSHQFSAQKFCRVVGGSLRWHDTLIVPNSWTLLHCKNLPGDPALHDGSNFTVGCLFSDGTVSVSPLNVAQAPTPNCGW
jgi:hypothetical protein